MSMLPYLKLIDVSIFSWWNFMLSDSNNFPWKC